MSLIFDSDELNATNILVFCSELEQSLAGYKYIAQNIYEKLILINIRFKTGSELNVVFTGNKYVWL